MSSKMILKLTLFLVWALSMPTVVDSQDLNDLLERIKKLERDVRRLKDAQVCNPSVVIDDVLNTTTNETIDQIVTCRYRDDLVDNVEFGQTNVVFNGTIIFNDTVTVKDDIFFENSKCTPRYSRLHDMCYYDDEKITFRRGDVKFDDDVRFNRPVKFRSNVEINLDRFETFNVNGPGQMTVATSQPLDVETLARFQGTNGVEIDNDLTVTQGDITIEEGSLGVAKNTIIGGELNVDGEADFDDKVTVDGDLKVKKKLSVEKESRFNRDIEVRGTIEARDEIISQQFTVGEDEYGEGKNANITFGSFTAGCNGQAKNGIIVSGGGLFANDLGARTVDASGTVCAASVDAPGFGGGPGVPTNPLVVQSLQITGPAGGTGPVINLSSGSGGGVFSDRKGLIVDQPMFSPQIGAQNIGTESNVRVGGDIVFGDGSGPRITSGRKTVNNLNVGGTSSETVRGIVVENLAADNILVDSITAGTYFNLPVIVEPFEVKDQCACVEEKWINSVNADIAKFDASLQGTDGLTTPECGCDIDDVADDLVDMGFFTKDDAKPVFDRLKTVEKVGKTVLGNITSIDERLKEVESAETTLSSNVTSMNNLILEALGLDP